MRAIIIDDKDAQALLRDLELKKMLADNVIGEHQTKPPAWTEDAWRQSVIDGLHRSFHFVVVRWLQDQGCDCVRR